MPRVQVDPQEFLTASQVLATSNTGAVDAVTSLVGVLDSCGGMAGSDTGGQNWSKGYDESAASLIESAGAVATGLGVAADLLSATGSNHATAEADSTPGGAGLTSGGFPGQSSGMDYYGHGGSSTGTEAITPAAPPTANGGSKDEPHGWFLVEDLLQYAWPNGHQDTLRRAGTAWSNAATAFSARADLLPGAISTINAQKTPEAPDAVGKVQDLQKGLTDLSSGFTEMAGACNDYATHLDEAHHEIISELESLLAWTIASEATGALLTVFTAGISDAAAQGAVAARCAVAAERIGGVIGRLIETVGTLVQRVVNLAAKAIEISNKVKTFIAARRTAAVAKVASKLPGAAKAGKTASSAVEIAEGGTAAAAGATAKAVTKATVKAGEDAGDAAASGAAKAAYQPTARRVGLRAGTKRAVVSDAERTADGDLVCDASGDVIPAARNADGSLVRVDPATGRPDPNGMTVPEKGTFHYGHRPGHEWADYKADAEAQGLTRQQVIEDQNDPGIYRIETKAANESHAYETPRAR